MGESYVLKNDPKVRVNSRAHKMSKSRGNVVNPDDIVSEYGADSLRLYEMFMGPLRCVTYSIPMFNVFLIILLSIAFESDKIHGCTSEIRRFGAQMELKVCIGFWAVPGGL